MSIRRLAFVLLAGVSLAIAAPPKTDPQSSAPPTDTIDVDAMARAKDVDTNAAQNSTDSTATQTTQDATAPAPPAGAAGTPPETPPAATAIDSGAPASMPKSSAPAAAPTAAETNAAPTSVPPSLEAPTAEPDSAEKRIAAGCVSRATSLLDDAQKADFGSATRDFDAKMRTDMPAPKFKQQWESLSQFGRLVARGQSHLGSGQGYTIVMIPLIFEKTNLVAQIACGSDGRIAGFHVTPAPKPQF